MSKTPVRGRLRSGAASSAKRKRGDESSDISSDKGDRSMSANDTAESVEASEEDVDDDDEVIIRTRPSLRKKNKKRKVSKKAAKSRSSKRAAEEESDNDRSSSSPEPEKGLKVERHAKFFRRAEKELEEERKRLNAENPKFTVSLILSDSSTEGDGYPSSIDLPGKKGDAFKEGRNRAGRRVARAMNKSVLNRVRDHPPGTAEEFESLIPSPQYDDEYWTEERQRELEKRLDDDKDFKKQLNISECVVGIWKTVFRFTGRLATDIVGPRTGLEFKELASIIEKHQDGTKTASQLREAAAYVYMKARGRTAGPPVWSQFLSQIEAKALQHSEGASGGGASGGGASGGGDVRGGPYFVNTTDLYVVRSALDRLKHLSLRQFADSRQVVDAVMPTMSKDDVPSTELTQRAIKAVLLYKERNNERLRLHGPPEVLPSPILDLKPPS
ncbi:hypothetical protein KVR01_004401 [Diaporthe batatas]|uniref:uncharacterized protein n=1 Tax=Diaporthe batatas TaxID=748121 RepID=UPI001D039DF6|nr:uncharacterized protein KVR01_004401 [Diaporthe batatas]KAG8165849.1 hypothetical protein KVR01_004401 [Diaporthe batatas]